MILNLPEYCNILEFWSCMPLSNYPNELNLKTSGMKDVTMMIQSINGMFKIPLREKKKIVPALIFLLITLKSTPINQNSKYSSIP